ncbi:MAG: uL15 family ribosomal protein [Clostridia bacterium]|nr:uL15 family ribosomal protein [Clostridia bacterium]
MALLNTLMAFNLLDGGVGLIVTAAVLVLAVIAIIFLAFVKKEVIYIDPDTDYEIAHKKYGWGRKITVASANKTGKKFIGWAYDENGIKRLGKLKIRLFKTTELYAVWANPGVSSAEEANFGLDFVYINDRTNEDLSKDSFAFLVNIPKEIDGEPILGWGLDTVSGPTITPEAVENKSVLTVELYPYREGWEEELARAEAEEAAAAAAAEAEAAAAAEAEKEPEANATVELVYMNDADDSEIDKNSAPLTLTVPMEVNGESIIGWGLDAHSAPIIKVDEESGTVTIQLYPVREGWDEVVEEAPVEEPVVEEVETAQEVVEEAPVEEVAEEEPVEEEPFVEVIEEPIEEEPVEEVVEEAPVEEVAEEEPVEEVVEEAPAEEVVEEAPVEEPVVEEVVDEAPADEPVVVVPVIVPTYVDGHGNELNIKYSRSITANIIQAEDDVKNYYSELKNHILSYKGVKSRFSWKFDSYNKGRTQLFKIKLRGKTLCLYCALDPNEFEKSKYHHEAIDAKIFAEVPMLVKVKSKLGLKKAKELVDIVMAKFALDLNPKAKVIDYVNEYPYEETDALVQKGLIKILQADASDIKKAAPIVEEPVVEEVVEEAPVEEPVEEVVEEAPVEEPVVEEVVEEAPVEEPVVEEAVEEAPVEEPVVEEAVEEAPAEEPVVEEAVEEEPVVEAAPATTVEEMPIVESVSAEEVDDLVVDEVVDSLVEEDVEYITKEDTKKAIVNVDTLSASYEAGETVDLASLKAKGLIHKKSKSVKILARGTLDKPLIVKAGEFSETALKMIVLTGGKAVHTVSKVK